MTQLSPLDSHLASFPRPEGDNGRGIHFVLDSRQPFVEHYAPYLKRMKIKWATVYGGDEAQCIRVAKYLKDNFGIFSNMRVYASGERPKTPDFWEKFAQLSVKNGVPPYIQIFNEPEDGREGFDSPEHFASLWGQRAEAVVRGGGFPGLQVLSEELLASVSGVSKEVKNKMYFSLHNYGANHPPIYPYPSSNVYEDDTAVLRFIAIAGWCEKHLGIIPPMIGGEGGWLFKNHDDTSMPEVSIEKWIDWHYEMYEWFRVGKLSNGERLPDYLFAVCPWLLWAGNWYSDSWVDGLHSDPAHADEHSNPNVFKSDLIQKMEMDLPYIRQFGWEDSDVPPPPSGVEYDAELELYGVPSTVWTGETVASMVSMTNTGNVAWGNVALSPTSNNEISWQAVPSNSEVKPNESYRFNLMISAPFRDGVYRFEGQLRDYSGSFFGEIVKGQVTVKSEEWMVEVDKRLTWVSVTQGSGYKVSAVHFYDNKPVDYPESQGGVKIMVSVSDGNGKLLWKVPVTQVWPDDKAIHHTRNGMVDFDMSGDSSFDPQRGQVGPYSIRVGDCEVRGLGLPLKQHVEYGIEIVKV